jgi:hypothetical protein
MVKSLSSLLCFILFACCLASVAESQVASNEGCVVDAESRGVPQCALESRDGHLYVAKQYLKILLRSAKGPLVARMIPDGGWAYFNRRGLVVVQNVATFDNSADDFHHGLVRIVREDKWGLANAEGVMVVPFEYDGILDPDSDSNRWLVCKRCRNAGDGEHHWFEGGDWYWLDQKGQFAGKAEDPANAPSKPAK